MSVVERPQALLPRGRAPGPHRHQYPVPVAPDEDEAALAVTFVPLGATAHQTLANACPFTSPACESARNKYRGIPPRVSCFVPSSRVIVLSFPVTPLAAGVPEVAGTGDHLVRQLAVQALVPAPGVSLSNTYTVRPPESTTTFPSAVLDVVRTAFDEAGAEDELELAAELPPYVVEPQPANASSARADAPLRIDVALTLGLLRSAGPDLPAPDTLSTDHGHVRFSGPGAGPVCRGNEAGWGT
jgi:hypothetical protein